MRGIAKLLFGDEAASMLDRFAGNDADESGAAEQARRSGDWCGTTPGRGAASRLLRGTVRPGRVRGESVIRDFDW